MLDLNKKTVLITGGTGLLGHSLVESLLRQFPEVDRIIIFSRDEQKQYEMQQTYNSSLHPGIQYILGDIRDAKGLAMAFLGVDVIIHAAALKQVPTSEFNPSQFIQTNITGTENLIRAALQHKVEAVMAISTDKAVEPASTYGATKLCMEKLMMQANFIQYNNKTASTIFSVVRLGNLLGARGSVVPAFLEARNKGVIPLVHPESSRFHITSWEAADFTINRLVNSRGGEICIPKMPSFKITALAEAIAPECRQESIGLRPGEKIHEIIIPETEAPYTFDFGTYYTVYSPVLYKQFFPEKQSDQVAADFSYCSASNTTWLTTKELGKIIHQLEKNAKPPGGSV